jgi:hypothetical protein
MVHGPCAQASWETFIFTELLTVIEFTQRHLRHQTQHSRSYIVTEWRFFGYNRHLIRLKYTQCACFVPIQLMEKCATTVTLFKVWPLWHWKVVTLTSQESNRNEICSVMSPDLGVWKSFRWSIALGVTKCGCQTTDNMWSMHVIVISHQTRVE